MRPIPDWMRPVTTPDDWRTSPLPAHSARGRSGAARRAACAFAGLLADMLSNEETAARPGILQRTDPRVKVVAVLALVVAATLVRSVVVLAALYGACVALAAVVARAGWAYRAGLARCAAVLGGDGPSGDAERRHARFAGSNAAARESGANRYRRGADRGGAICAEGGGLRNARDASDVDHASGPALFGPAGAGSAEGVRDPAEYDGAVSVGAWRAPPRRYIWRRRAGRFRTAACATSTPGLPREWGRCFEGRAPSGMRSILL